MLLLVVLARLDDRVDLAEAVEAEADVLQDGAGRPTSTSLGPTMPAFERYSSSTSSRIASGSRATSSWQKQKNPLSPSTRRSTSLAAAPKPGLAPSVADERVGQASADRGREVVGSSASAVAGEQEQGVEVGVVLAGERRRASRRTRARAVDDDDGDDRRRGGASVSTEVRG